MEFHQNKLVDAIEEGRIVKVTEEYARQEGLTILRKLPPLDQKTQASYLQKKEKPKAELKVDILDSLKKPLSWKEKQVVSELISNWQWHIRMERRKKGFSRKQLADKINETEDTVKMFEFGSLTAPDFVIINKIQQALQINLRKDKKDFSQDLPDMMKQTQQDNQSSSRPTSSYKSSSELTGSDIEILEDEI